MAKDNLIRLLDSGGRVITEIHPDFRSRLLEFSEYNPNPERRGRAKPVSQTGAESWRKQRDRYTAMADAREAVELDFVGGVIERLTLYVAGKLHCKSNTGDGQIDAAYDGYLHSWCGDDRGEDGGTMCDLSGRARFIEMVQMAYHGFMVDGDAGFVEIAPQFSPTGGYCLQSIEADRIGSPTEATQAENYIGGFTIDENTGRILSARIFRHKKDGSYTDQQEVPMDSFIHLHDPYRPGEYRGRTKLLRCLNDIRDIREWIEAEKIAGKVQAQYAALIGTKDPFNGNGPGAWDGKTAQGTPTQDAQWGKLLKLAEGENFSMMSPSARPSGAFMAFVQTLIRKMSVSLGISYGLLWDISVLGGANTRVEIQADLRKIESWQGLLENLVLNRVRQKVIAQGISLGVLPPTPGWKQCAWHWSRPITADLGHEAQADLSLAAAGILEIEEVVAKHTGKSFGEVVASNFAAGNKLIEEAAKAQLPGETVARGLFGSITQEKAAFLTPTPMPPPPPLSIQAVGDKGLKLIVEIMEKVGNGTIDRESAVEMILKGFPGSTRSEAEKIIPEEPEEEQLNRNAGLTPEGAHAPVVAGPKTTSSNGSKPKVNGSSS
jgi:hypothetical protein